MRQLAAAIVAVGFLCAAPTASEAGPLIFNLNCVLSTTCDSSASWGTVTLTDNGNNVDLTVDLVDTPDGTSRQKMLGIWLNYDDLLFGATNDFGTFSSDGVDENENKKKSGGYAGRFDMVLPDTGNGGFEPYTVTMYLDGYNLDPSNFLYKDTDSLLWAAVHIGNCGSRTAACAPGVAPGDGSTGIWVGASSVAVDGEQITAVPEPGSLLLLGTGLVAVARRVSRR